jgi:hypothetical protein
MVFMPHEKNRFAEVRRQSKAKRAEIDLKTTERKAKEARELADTAAERVAREAPRKNKEAT